MAAGPCREKEENLAAGAGRQAKESVAVWIRRALGKNLAARHETQEKMGENPMRSRRCVAFGHLCDAFDSKGGVGGFSRRGGTGNLGNRGLHGAGSAGFL